MTSEHWLAGPPGTGKTTTLSRRIQAAIRKHGSDGVLVSSFTKAAAVELAGRDLDLDKGRVGTLHSLCYKALGMPEIAESHIAEFNAEHTHRNLAPGRPPTDEDSPYKESNDRDNDYFSAYQNGRAAMLSRDEITSSFAGKRDPDLLIDFIEEWEAWKRKHEYMDFSDLLEHALHSMDRPPLEAAVLFIDEAQDCSPLTIAVARKWASVMDELHLAFDDDQAVYGFAGADPQRIFTPLPPDIEVLAQSYRVPRAVHLLADKWRKQLSWSLPKEYRPRDADGKVTVRWDLDYDNPDGLADLIGELAADGHDVMLLASCGFMLNRTNAALKRAGLPFHNPYRPDRAEWNPLAPGTSRRMTPAGRVRAFLRPSTSVFGEAARLWDADDFRAWAPHVKTELFVRGAKTAIGSKEFTLPAGRQEKIDYINSLLVNPLAFLPAWSGSLSWLDKNLQGATGERMAYPITVVQKQGYRAMLSPRVVTGTVHSVKGGQASRVILLPDLSSQGYAEWVAGGTQRDAVRRMAYVGMTRARDELILTGNAQPKHFAPWEALC